MLTAAENNKQKNLVMYVTYDGVDYKFMASLAIQMEDSGRIPYMVITITCVIHQG